jgi:hypothetical protein
MINTVEKTYQKSRTDDTQVWSNYYKITFTDGTEQHVPHDEANRHYQEILEWVAEGNTITDNGGGE